MAARSAPTNRGPAAAAENRRALLDAARTLFAAEGLQVPLSAIARAAGVGQGVLYRHFPDRLSLAFAILDENLTELEAIAVDPDATTFARLWGRILEFTVHDAAFAEMVVEARRSHAYDGGQRFLALMQAPLDRAIEAGNIDAALTIDDVLLAQRMIYGAVVTSADADAARASASEAVELLRRAGLRLPAPR